MNTGILKAATQKKSREDKLRQFYRHCDKPCAVLDVGVSRRALRDRRIPANCFLKTFCFPPACYTGLGVDDMTGMPALYPGKIFVTYDDRIFSFENNRFDATFSNAVVKHAGDRESSCLSSMKCLG